MTLTGKGYYIWKVKHCENGDPDRIAALARDSNLSHVLIKIADGAFPYNIDLENGYDYARPAIKKLQAQNVQVWGWQYVYGDYPDQEAEIAVKRARDLGVDGFVVNAEVEYQRRTKAPAASRYMNILRSNLGSMPIALSSFRYPSYHINFPWAEFLDRCDYNMPQVYWVQSHNNAGEQLQRCVNEFKQMRPFRPIIPTGPTYKESGWIPTKAEVIEFMQVAKNLGLSAVNFWYWEGARGYMPEFWNLVRDYDYDEPVPQVSQPVRFITALNSGDPDKVAALYDDNAIVIRPQHVSQGKEAIRAWIASLMEQFKDGEFNLLGGSSYDNVFSFQWEARNAVGETLRGRDTQGLHDEKINFHYSFIKKVPTAS
ncbi:nuclear transport factor 2 family protein [bacterium]|nr:nuclear transport factor 2 family protein [bacterium]